MMAPIFTKLLYPRGSPESDARTISETKVLSSGYVNGDAHAHGSGDKDKIMNGNHNHDDKRASSVTSISTASTQTNGQTNHTVTNGLTFKWWRNIRATTSSSTTPSTPATPSSETSSNTSSNSKSINNSSATNINGRIKTKSPTFSSTSSNSNKSDTPSCGAHIRDDFECRWPIGVLIFNQSSQALGYQFLSSALKQKLKKWKIELLSEMVFGSVALNFSGGSISKMHQLEEHLLMTSVIFNLASSGQRKYGIALIWDTKDNQDDNSTCGAHLRQFVLNESLILDSCIDLLTRDLVACRLRTPRTIHECVKKFLKSIDNYLSACKLSASITVEQFVDELSQLLSNYDTKSTHFFISTLLTAILMFKYKNDKLKTILWSRDERKISLMSQLLVVLNHFLRKSQILSNFMIPPMKNLKICHDNVLPPLNANLTCVNEKSETIGERKSRDESVGYGSLSLTESTSTIADSQETTNSSLYCMHSCYSLDQGLESSLESLSVTTAKGKNGTCTDDCNHSDTDNSYEDHDKYKLAQSRQFIRGYQHLRFTSNQYEEAANEVMNSNMSVNAIQATACNGIGMPSHVTSVSQGEESFCLNCTTNCTTLSDCNDSTCEVQSVIDIDNNIRKQAPVEEIHESKIIKKFGECLMPEVRLISRCKNTNRSLDPVISNNHLLHFSLQGIVKSQSIANIDELNSLVIKLGKEMSDEIFIIADCDSWHVNIIESSRSCPAIMSSAIGNLCETISLFHSCQMHAQFINDFIECKLNELRLKSNILQTILYPSSEAKFPSKSPLNHDSNRKNDYNHYTNHNRKCNFLTDESLALSSLIGDHNLYDLSLKGINNLGFDVSDIPIIVALKREQLSFSNMNTTYYSHSIHHQDQRFIKMMIEKNGQLVETQL